MSDLYNGERWPPKIRWISSVRSEKDGPGWRANGRDIRRISRLALEAPRGELTTAQLATKHAIHQTMVGEWKKQAVEGMVNLPRMSGHLV